MKIQNPKIFVVIAVIAVACLFRIMPHWPNFTPMAAIALMSGAMLSNRFMAFLLPFAAILVSDMLTVLFVNQAFTTPAQYFGSTGILFIYLAFAFMILIGMGISKNLRWPVLGLASISTAIIFFLLSNFGFWIGSTLPQNPAGLLLAYEMGLPFFLNNILGDLFFTFTAFGLVALLTNRYPQLILIRSKS